MTEIKTRSRRDNFYIIVMLGILDVVTPFSIDMYLPSFSEIAKHFATTTERVAFSVSTYFFGFALGQIIYGPVLDHYGRKPPLYVGLILYIFASIACAQAPTIEMFFLFRFLQALGGSVASVAAIAMVSDFFAVEESAKIFSLMMLVLSVSPFLAPSVGGLIVKWWAWQTVFGVLAAFAGLVILMVYFLLPDVYKPDPDAELSLTSILKVFKSILSNHSFYVYTFAGSFAFAGLFVFIAGSPTIFMVSFKVSPQIYALIFAFLASAMIGGGQINIWLTKKFTSKDLFKWMVIAEAVVGLFFVAGSLMGQLNLYSTIGLLFLILMAAGISYPNAASIALAPFSKNAGSAAALLGFLQLGIGSLISAGVGMIDIKGSLPTAAITLASALIALAILFFTRTTPTKNLL